MKTKLTPEDLEALITETTFYSHGTLTMCVLDLKGGAAVVGTSNCIDPANFDKEMGRSVARQNAVGKMWELEGYACKTRGFTENA
tara:strand:+ start:10778 stop:11032 length:255 start_codon:yes stop_codon:yes gene_type:complete